MTANTTTFVRGLRTPTSTSRSTCSSSPGCSNSEGGQALVVEMRRRAEIRLERGESAVEAGHDAGWYDSRPWTLNDSRLDDEPEHVCGPFPYLFGGDCAGCEWRSDRA